MPRQAKNSTGFGARRRTDRNVIGPSVRRLRNLNSWSQTDLARKCQLAGLDWGRDIVAKVERGEREVTDREILVLRKVLGVSADSLLDYSS